MKQAVLVGAVAPREDAGYVDSGACAGCSRAIYDRYRRPHGAILLPSHSGKYGRGLSTKQYVYHQASDRYYTIYNRAGRYYQRAIRLDPTDARRTSSREIHYVLGSEIIPAPILQDRRRAITAIADRWYSERGGFWL